MVNTESKYFAAQESTKTAGILLQKADSWTNNLISNGYLDKLRRMYSSYHGAYYSSVGDAHTVSFSGEQGELVNLPINHMRNLAQHIIIMTT